MGIISHNGRIRFIWHYRAKGVGPDHIVEVVRRHCSKKGIRGERLNILPHDGDVEEWTATSKRSDYIRNMGERVETLSKADLVKADMGMLITQINSIRTYFNMVEIDDIECYEGVIKLQEYVRKFNRSTGEYIDIPDHDANDKASDDADAFRTGMIYYINNLMKSGNNYGGAITTEGQAITFRDNDYLDWNNNYY